MKAYAGAVFHMIDDPSIVGIEAAHEYFENGLLVVEDGHVIAAGNRVDIESTLPEGTEITDHGSNLLVPGFVDTHIHFPQLDMIASFGEQLLDWLNKFNCPCDPTLLTIHMPATPNLQEHAGDRSTLDITSLAEYTLVLRTPQ